MSRKTRKLIWSVPLMAAIAVVGALALFMTLQPNGAAAQTEEQIPGAPINLTAAGISPTSIELTWDPPMVGDGGDPDFYRIDHSPDGLVWYSLDPTYDSTIYTDNNGLSAIETRHYRVFAVNSSGTSDVLGPVSGTTERSTVPKAIKDLMATTKDTVESPPSPHQEVIRLDWTAPDYPDGAPVTDYRIQVSKDGKSFSDLETVTAKVAGCDAGEACMYPHKDLLESTKRWYRVYAINKMGESAASSDAPEGSTAVGIIPGLVPGVRAGLNRGGKIFLYWDPPVDDTSVDGDQGDPEGAPILGYYIQGERGAAATEEPGQLSDVPRKEKLVYVGANTDIPITDTLQKQLATTGNISTQWSFRVIAANRVVDRNLLDGTLNLAGNDIEANASLPLPFDAAKDDAAEADDNLLDAPTLTVSRDTNNVGGRVSLVLDWDVDGDVTGTAYRVEHSADLVDWEEIHPAAAVDATGTFAVDGTDATKGTHIGLVAGTTHHYRVFATHPRTVIADGVFTEASRDVKQTTAGAAQPDPPMLDDPTGESETVIAMAWTPPVTADEDDATMSAAGLEPVGYGRITGYQIYSSSDGTTFTPLVKVGPKLNVTYSYNDETGVLTKKADGDDAKVDFEHTNLVQDQTVHYRVSTINNASPRVQESDASFTKSATTRRSQASDDPGGLVVKSMGSTAIKLLWNARADDITAAEITGYRIESSPLKADDDCMEDWTVLEEDTMSTATSYTHGGLAAGTGQCYRVFGINVVATSTSFVGYGDAYVTTNDNDSIAMTDPPVAADAPVATATADSDTEITVTWTAPADGGSDITGWIVEKAYGGSFLDAERTNDDAFTDAQTWWDGLDCPNMVAAVMDDRTVDDTNPFCKMYAGLAMTEEDEVERVFGARYDVIDDAAQTNATYSDLTPETAYMYRVAAVNAVGPGAWSNTATAMTMATDTTLGDASGLTVDDSDSGAITVELSWTAGANANIHWVAGARKNNDGTYDLSTGNTYWSRADMNGSHSVDTTGLNSGTYSFTVIAGQLADDGTENWDSAWVTPFAEVELP